ncbi:MAG TPA: response regulator transcription factor [Dehalococcoidia bacterium]|nr:response regulator transcription factor [Dehalococcoidia bacterium]
MRVLLVEDEERMAALIAAGLAREGHAVDVAGDGETGLAMAQAAPFDLLVLDLMLPRMDGFTLCRALRERGAGLPILMLTARGEVEDRVAGLDAGADDYLTKPFAMSELQARLRALTRRGGERTATLRAADLRLDPLRREVARAGRRLELTAREFNLLEFLLRNCGQVLSRARILDAVWGEDAEPYGNVVDQYISYLRGKLDQHGPRLIETVRGVGYVLREPAEPETPLTKDSPWSVPPAAG